jgi:hypothetical protein
VADICWNSHSSIVFYTLLAWPLSWGTLVAFLSGAVCVVFSYLMVLLKQNQIVRLVLRDLLTIVGLGALLPVVWIVLNGLSFS